MRDVWTTKNRYMITWLRAANQMTYAALANAEVESQQQLALVPTEKTAKVIDFWSGRPLSMPPKQDAAVPTPSPPRSTPCKSC